MICILYALIFSINISCSKSLKSKKCMFRLSKTKKWFKKKFKNKQSKVFDNSKALIDYYRKKDFEKKLVIVEDYSKKNFGNIPHEIVKYIANNLLLWSFEVVPYKTKILPCRFINQHKEYKIFKKNCYNNFFFPVSLLNAFCDDIIAKNKIYEFYNYFFHINYNKNKALAFDPLNIIFFNSVELNTLLKLLKIENSMSHNGMYFFITSFLIGQNISPDKLETFYKLILAKNDIVLSQVGYFICGIKQRSDLEYVKTIYPLKKDNNSYIGSVIDNYHNQLDIINNIKILKRNCEYYYKYH